MKNSSFVLCTLPKAGLGNQLFPLMKASVFAHLNNLPLIVTGYRTLRIGPYLRREKSKRNYSGYFSFEKGRLGEWLERRRVARLKLKMNVTEEPELLTMENPSSGMIYSFTAQIRWDDFFFGLKKHRKLVIRLFWDLLKDQIIEELNEIEPPLIGVHIRLGDFRKLGVNENFRKVGGVRTPEHYFVEVINSIRRNAGSDLPVSIFTDGYRHELPELFKLSNISLIENNRDIIDLLLLSRSSLIVPSAGSTFSYWAGFLSDAPLIMHPDHIHKPIRGVSSENGCYEGIFDASNPTLKNSILNVSRPR